MKKLFTLIAGLLLAGSTFAQGEYSWRSIIKNGDMEGDDVSCWWSHEWDESVSMRDDGYCRIIEDPTDPTNHVAVVRTYNAEKQAEMDGDIQDWSAQFFIAWPEETPEVGMEIRVSFRFRADHEAQISSQAHNMPGDYNHYDAGMGGNLTATTEWQTVDKTFLITNDHFYGTGATADSENGKEFHSIAFNLYLEAYRIDNNFYFDDVIVEVRKPKPPKEQTGWFDLIHNGDLSSDDVRNFTEKNGDTANDYVNYAANIYEDPKDGKPTLRVMSVPTYEQITGTTDQSELMDWNTQFFITTTHKFKTGEPYKFSMMARADYPVQIESQTHNAPGEYIHWACVGTFDLTEEWQLFETEGTITSEQNGGYTIAFNCNKDREQINYMYFRDIKWEINDAEATDEDREWGSEEVVCRMGEDGFASLTIDMSEATKALGFDEQAEDYIYDETAKVLAPEGEDEDTEYTIEFSATNGFNIDENGRFSDEGDIVITFDAAEGDEVTFNVEDMGDVLTGDAAIVVPTRLAVVKDGKHYVYYITLVGAGAEDPTGIATVPAAGQTDGAIYDLSGRRVTNPVKGLYIKNGKKFIQK